MSYVVSHPIIDLRAKPEPLSTKGFAHDPNRLSQLLFNERLSLLKQENQWLYIEALDHPYRGWIHTSEATPIPTFVTYDLVVCAPTLQLPHLTLSYGTYLQGTPDGKIILANQAYSCDPQALRSLSSSFNRTHLTQEAHTFLNAPYLWGGCAHPKSHKSASVDCSGIIYLLYRAQGIQIPRDARDQYKAATPISYYELLPADPLYLAKERSPDRISHVILKIAPGIFIEAPETGKKVRILTQNVDFWKMGSQIHFRDRPYPYYLYPASLLNNP